jgi:hypothetical protein
MYLSSSRYISVKKIRLNEIVLLWIPSQEIQLRMEAESIEWFIVDQALSPRTHLPSVSSTGDTQEDNLLTGEGEGVGEEPEHITSGPL